MHKPNSKTPVQEPRRGSCPSISDLQQLIDKSRQLRLEFVRLGTVERIAAPALAGAETALQLTLALETIANLLAVPAPRKRRARKEPAPLGLREPEPTGEAK